MTKTFLTLVVVTFCSACSEEISFDRYKELGEAHCSCIEALETLRDTTCQDEHDALWDEQGAVGRKIEEYKESDPEYYREMRGTLDKITEDNFKCQIKNMELVNEKEHKRLQQEYLDSLGVY